MLLWDMLKDVKDSVFMKTMDKKTKDDYGEKRDYPKIEIFVNGKYDSTTTWAKTCAEAKEMFLKKHSDIEPATVKCSVKDSKDEKDILTKDRVDLNPGEYARAVGEEIMKLVTPAQLKKILGDVTIEGVMRAEIFTLGKLQNQEGMSPERAALYFKQNLFKLTGDKYTGDPLTAKGEEIKGNMEKEYGEKKGEQVFYASKNKGTIEGVDAEELEKCKECGKKYNPEKSDARDPEKFCSATCESSYPAGQAEYRYDMKQDR